MADRSPSMRGQVSPPPEARAVGGGGVGLALGAVLAVGPLEVTATASGMPSIGSTTGICSSSADSQVPQPHNRRPPAGTCTVRPQVAHRTFIVCRSLCRDSSVVIHYSAAG